MGRQSCWQPLWPRSSNPGCSGEDQGLKARPDELLRLKFSMLALRIRLVFLEVSAKAIQTFPKTRLGKNKAALPKLYIFPAFRELFEEQTDLHSSELELSGCRGVVLRSRRGLLLSGNVHPSLGGGTQPFGSRGSPCSVYAAGCRRAPLLWIQIQRNGHAREAAQPLASARQHLQLKKPNSLNLRLGSTKPQAATDQFPSRSASRQPEKKNLKIQRNRKALLILALCGFRALDL